MRRFFQVFAIVLSVIGVFSQRATAATYNFTYDFDESVHNISISRNYGDGFGGHIKLNNFNVGDVFKLSYSILNIDHKNKHYATFLEFNDRLIPLGAEVLANFHNNYGWTTISVGETAHLFLSVTSTVDFRGRYADVYFGVGAIPLPAPISLMFAALAGLFFVSRRKCGLTPRA